MIDPLPAESLRWRCNPAELPFETTRQVKPTAEVVGQDAAIEALRFGLECDAPGQNIFVRGITGTGRMKLVRNLLEELRTTCRNRHDHAYVHNFSRPECPRLITLDRGTARRFRQRVVGLADFVKQGLFELLGSDPVKTRRSALEEQTRSRIEAHTEPFEKELAEAGLQLVQIQVGQMPQTALFPVFEGQPVPPEQLEVLRTEGKVDEQQIEAWNKAREEFGKRMQDMASTLQEIQHEGMQAAKALVEDVSRRALEELAGGIRDEFPGKDVAAFLNEVIDDVVENRLDGSGEPKEDPHERYGVNVVLTDKADDSCPIVLETTPTLTSLLGTVERAWGPQGPAPSDYRMIRAGSLLRADGGYLVLEARDVLTEPGAWKVLVRTLRTGKLEIVPQEFSSPFWNPSIKPEPIPLHLRVILVGDAALYYLLDQHDPDFGELFKVLADFDSEVERSAEGVQKYADVLCALADREGLPHFNRTAVAALAEHGARIAARKGKLTARFGRISDIAREAAFLARKAGEENVTADRVFEAVKRTRSRADLPSRKFQSLLADGTIQVETRGAVVGQINGLAVISAGPLTYGFPARVTATIGPGSAGIVNIEGRASLSGSIHTKGFQILGGLLRHLLQLDHPLTFSASVAFEQSYGGIDGDSASGAEICCLLSALTDLPISQGLAMTGAIDQHGHIQAIGGVNEKVEGFFDACSGMGLSGEQGVIIPAANAGDLMLRQDVVDACAQGRFRVYGVRTIHEALELLTGTPAGVRDEEGNYPEDSVLGLAVDQAQLFWERSLLHPSALLAMATGEEEDEAAGPGEQAAADAE